MREDDALLDQAAGLVKAGEITREDYHEIWVTVMAERTAEFPVPDQACGHPWSDGQRVWVGHLPTDEIRCRACVRRDDADVSPRLQVPQEDRVQPPPGVELTRSFRAASLGLPPRSSSAGDDLEMAISPGELVTAAVSRVRPE